MPLREWSRDAGNRERAVWDKLWKRASEERQEPLMCAVDSNDVQNRVRNGNRVRVRVR